MLYWPFSRSRSPSSSTEALELESKMADQVRFAKRVRKSLYYGEYSDGSLPSLSVTDVAVEVLNNTVPPRKRLLDRKYAHSVARRAKISPCTLMMGMLYAERLRQRNPHSTTTLNSSDVFLISIMVASKYLYDEGEEEEVYNEDWAKAGCKTVQDVNKLEMDFLQLMDWNLFISKDEFLKFVNQVESRVAITKGSSRGWLTYSDMCTLLNNTTLLTMLLEIQQLLLKNISKCLAAYMLGISILLGSSALGSLTRDSVQQETIPTHTPNHPTFNCLTTEASCVFSRESIDVASKELNQVFPRIAQRKMRAQESLFRRQLFRNETKSLEQKATTQEPPLSSENRTFDKGSNNVNPFIENLGNLSSQNLKSNPIYYSHDWKNSIWKFSGNTGSSFCVRNTNESISNSIAKVDKPRPQFVNKTGCFEEFLGSRESSNEWSCFHRQQVCFS